MSLAFECRFVPGHFGVLFYLVIRWEYAGTHSQLAGSERMRSSTARTPARWVGSSRPPPTSARKESRGVSDFTRRKDTGAPLLAEG